MYQVKHPQEPKFPVPLNVIYHHKTIKLTVELMIEPLRTLLKEICENTVKVID